MRLAPGSHVISLLTADNENVSVLTATENGYGKRTPIGDYTRHGRGTQGMTRLESRPARTGRWEYVFYVDLEGHQQDANVAQALRELAEKAAFLKNLGSYPAGTV